MLNQIIVTGGSQIREISLDQDSNVWVTNLDGTVQIIAGSTGAVSTAQGLAFISGLANSYGFGGQFPSELSVTTYCIAPIFTLACPDKTQRHGQFH